MARLPRYATKFDFARVLQRDIMAGESVSAIARKYGITRRCVYNLAYGSRHRQMMPLAKLMEFLGYDPRLPYYSLKRQNGDDKSK